MLNKIVRRQLHLLEFLWDNPPLSVKEIAKQIGVSEKTLRCDLDVVNTFLAPLYVEVSASSIVHLSRELNTGKNAIYSKIYHESIEFQLIETAFFYDFSSLADLSEALYSSPTTVKRVIKRMNRILKEERIHVRSNGQLIGDEQDIIHFMTLYLLEKYEHAEYLLPKRELQMLDILIAQFIKNNDLFFSEKPLDFPMQNKLRIRLYVGIARIQQGILPKKPLRSTIVDTALLHNTQFLHEFYNCFFIHLSPNALMQFFYPYIRHTANYHYMMKTKKQAVYTLYQVAQQLLSDVTQTFHLPKVPYHTDELLVKICQSIQQQHQRAYILYDYQLDFLTSISQTHALFIDYVEERLAVLLLPCMSVLQHYPVICCRIIFLLFTHWPELLTHVECLAPRLNACLFMNTGKEHIQFLQRQLQHHLDRRYTFVIAPAASVVELQQISHKYDCILTNLANLFIEGHDVIVLSNCLTTADIDRLLCYYESKIKFSL